MQNPEKVPGLLLCKIAACGLPRQYKVNSTFISARSIRREIVK
jgi:hypothetical protein